ncbi:unnamed protein product [Mytilus coruscus]|uniref:Uncharacterized protein n=1 Tax=Mytilus coruscus TaxID=42192 RepID=A0A6J8BIU2_MYTCO|nr:unnamed protein product [Mytilus coruscus]
MVPVGEPIQPLSTGVRPHNRSITLWIKKCGNCLFYISTINPPRLSQGLFEALHWIPDPVPVLKDSDEYKSVDEVYGRKTDDFVRPGLGSKNTPTAADLGHRRYFVATRASSFIICRECGKRSVAYSGKWLTVDQTRINERVHDEFIFTIWNRPVNM